MSEAPAERPEAVPSSKPNPRHELVRATLSVLAILALIAGCFWILKPFIPALLWASTIVIATWPLLLALQRRLWGRRALAVAVMTTVLLLVLVVPMAVGVASLVDHADEIAAWVGSLQGRTMPPPPAWLAKIPLAGEQLTALWNEAAASGGESLLGQLVPYADKFIAWLIAKIGGVGIVLVQFFLTVLVAAILYAHGETAAREVVRVARRLAGDAGENAVVLMGQTIKGVAMGIVVTAFVQACLGALGLLVAGVPSVGILAGVMLVLGIAQIGPAPVLLAGVAWLYWKDESGWAVALLAWTIVVGTLDNFIRPALIRRGADLPFVLVFVGVLGGLVSLGVVGLFVGPVVLAVAYRLLEAWVAQGESDPAPASVPK